MAEFFTEFSQHLVLENTDQESWARQELNRAEEEGQADWLGLEEEDRDDSLGFAWEILGTLDDSQDPRRLWIHAAEDGDPDTVARFAQAFLKRFRPGGRFSLSYAETCSKPRAGAFGGGAVLVTADTIDHFSARGWLQERVQRVEKDFGPPAVHGGEPG